jgi:quercetin dioxygenase-like cupin family protein
MQTSLPDRNKQSAAGKGLSQGSPQTRLIRHFDELEFHNAGTTRWARAFGVEEGTRKLSLYVVELDPGECEPIVLGNSEAALYVEGGAGSVDIGGRKFPLEAGCGAHVRAGEACALEASGPEPLRLLIAVCPSLQHAPWDLQKKQSSTAHANGFDENYPGRVVQPDMQKRERTGDRWYKVMVGPAMGSRAVTQFIGMIPRSRAPEHYHLYEEVICVLSGSGQIWIGEESTAVRPGSLIFLPREQRHSLECTVDEGLVLVGMFYPAGSPAVNYETEGENG